MIRRGGETSTGCAEDQATDIEFISRTKAILGRLVHDLVEGGEDIVRELDLSNGRFPHGGIPDGEPSYPLFTERGIENTMWTKLFS
jgi:hypothetical protein